MFVWSFNYPINEFPNNENPSLGANACDHLILLFFFFLNAYFALLMGFLVNKRFQWASS